MDQNLTLANCLFFRTEIEWYPGKCLTQKVLQKKPKKGSKDTKPIVMTQDCESFFNFFNPPQVPDDDKEIDEDAVSWTRLFICGYAFVWKIVLIYDFSVCCFYHQAVQLQDQMEQDYDIGYCTFTIFYKLCHCVRLSVNIVEPYFYLYWLWNCMLYFYLLLLMFYCQIYSQGEDHSTCCFLVHWRGSRWGLWWHHSRGWRKLQRWWWIWWGRRRWRRRMKIVTYGGLIVIPSGINFVLENCCFSDWSEGVAAG